MPALSGLVTRVCTLVHTMSKGLLGEEWVARTMPVVGLPFTLENMLQSTINDTNLISWSINGNGPLTYINLKFNTDSIHDKPEQDNNQVKYKLVNQIRYTDIKLELMTINSQKTMAELTMLLFEIKIRAPMN